MYIVQRPKLNWDSKEDVDWVAYFESMASKEVDASTLARAILLAKAQKTAAEEAKVNKRGKNEQTNPKQPEEKRKRSQGLGKRLHKDTKSSKGNRRSERKAATTAPKPQEIRHSPRRPAKVMIRY